MTPTQKVATLYLQANPLPRGFTYDLAYDLSDLSKGGGVVNRVARQVEDQLPLKESDYQGVLKYLDEHINDLPDGIRLPGLGPNRLDHKRWRDIRSRLVRYHQEVGAVKTGTTGGARPVVAGFTMNEVLRDYVADHTGADPKKHTGEGGSKRAPPSSSSKNALKGVTVQATLVFKAVKDLARLGNRYKKLKNNYRHQVLEDNAAAIQALNHKAQSVVTSCWVALTHAQSTSNLTKVDGGDSGNIWVLDHAIEDMKEALNGVKQSGVMASPLDDTAAPHTVDDLVKKVTSLSDPAIKLMSGAGMAVHGYKETAR